jgi:hypothetical protein
VLAIWPIKGVFFGLQILLKLHPPWKFGNESVYATISYYYIKQNGQTTPYIGESVGAGGP